MATLKVLMDGDKVCIAWFKKKQVMLTTKVEPVGSGTITPASGKVDKGAEVVIEAVAAENNEFDRFTVNGKEVEEDEEEPPTPPEGAIIPQDYATGNGSESNPWANDCIKKAYTACPTGGTIYLKAGYYQLAGVFAITKSINVIGEGMGKTIIVTANTDGIWAEANHVTFKGFTVDGDAQEDGEISGGACFNLDGDYFVLEDIGVKNAGYYGIVTQCDYSLFTNLHGWDNWRHAFHPTGVGAGVNTHNTWRNIYCWDNGNSGISIGGSETDPELMRYNVYDNIHSWDNGDAGIAAGAMSGCILSNSSATGNTTMGFYLANAADMVVDNCIAYLNEQDGFYFSDLNENVIVSNCIAKNNCQTSRSVGIYIQDSDEIKFVSCRVYDDGDPQEQEYGLYTSGTVDYVELVNCDFEGNGTAAIYNDGSSTIISN